MLKAIIFDADNTLYKVNKARAYKNMFLALEKETGIKECALEAAWKTETANLKNSFGEKSLNYRREGTIAAILEKPGVAATEKEKERISHIALGAFWKAIIEDLGFSGDEKKMMGELKKKYVLAVASDEFRKPLEEKLSRIFGAGYRRYFGAIICADDAGEHKPSENYCKRALHELKIKPDEAITVGDSWERDLEIPKKLGIKTVLIAGKKAGAPDYFINGLPELLAVLRRNGE